MSQLKILNSMSEINSEIKVLNPIIKTERFLIRKLVSEDVTNNYLSWLKNSDNSRWIGYGGDMVDIDNLRLY